MTDWIVFLVSLMALQACAAPAVRRAPEAGGLARAAAPAAAAAAPGAAREGAPDDAAIERRVEEDSEPLRQVHDAEAHGAMGLGADAPAGAAAPPGPANPTGSDELAQTNGPEGRVPALPEIDHDVRRLEEEYDIPIEVNDAVVRYVRFFQSPEVRPHVVRWLSRYERYGPRLREILREEGLPEDTVYLAMIESGFANLATSRAKAVGPWQFIPETGKRFGLRQDFWVDERRDPEKAARAAARFLRALHRENGDWRLAWAAYNAGPGRISRARKLGYSGFWDMARARRVLPAETRAYVPKIMAAAILAKHAEAFGFARAELEPERWIDYAEVVVPRTTELSFLAEAARVSVDVLLDLNPELRRTVTPPRRYALKIPRDAAQAFSARWPRIAARAARTAVARHRVRRGESLWTLARRFGVTVDQLARWNGIRGPERHALRAGSLLTIEGRTSAPGVRAARAALKPDRAKRRPEAAAPKPRTVRVRAGDSLWSLARRFGVTIQELANWNGIRRPHRHTLHAGRVLVVRPRAAARGGGA